MHSSISVNSGEEYLDTESGIGEEDSISTHNSEEELNYEGIEFKIEDNFYKETAEIRHKNIASLELLKKSEESEESEGNLKVI